MSSVDAAKRHCDSLGVDCKGFTYKGGPNISNSANPLVLFKNTTAANHSGWDMDKSWATYLKRLPAPPNSGRVLRFVTRVGGDGGAGALTRSGPHGARKPGGDLQLLPFNRIVDQRYAVHFNLTGAAARLPYGGAAC